ncbi:MAG: M23 family metallopeptidase [Deltaproteobacteria bacterium]|nr:M23 family metallopeptidase [Deltaproteobacteria bacterium]
MRKKGDSCTLIIVTKREAPARRIHLPGNILLVSLTIFTVLLLVATYFIYDYVSIRRDKAELYALRTITKNQGEQFETLSKQVVVLNERMDELKVLDEKIRSIANLDKQAGKKPVMSVGGPINPNNKLRALLEGNDMAVIEEINQSLENLSNNAEEQKLSFSQLIDFLTKQKSILAATPSIWPVRGWVTSEFGPRIGPFSGKKEFHNGIDIATAAGTPVRVSAVGIVAGASYQPYLGNTVLIEHGYGMKTVYAHLQSISVKVGKQVKQGDIVGKIGSTGRSTGPHLHYTVLIDGVPVNPRKYLRR